MSDRCPLTDLLPDQCGCKNHRNCPIDAVINYSDYAVARFLAARFDGRCIVEPSHAIHQHDQIGQVMEQRHGQVIGYCCTACVKAITG